MEIIENEDDESNELDDFMNPTQSKVNVISDLDGFGHIRNDSDFTGIDSCLLSKRLDNLQPNQLDRSPRGNLDDEFDGFQMVMNGQNSDNIDDLFKLLM